VSIYLRGSQLPANGLKEKKGYQRKEERYILHPCVVHVYLPAARKHLLANLSTQHTKGGKNNNKKNHSETSLYFSAVSYFFSCVCDDLISKEKRKG
jgi:hypothetical protein